MPPQQAEPYYACPSPAADHSHQLSPTGPSTEATPAPTPHGLTITGCAVQPAWHKAGPGRSSWGRDMPERSQREAEVKKGLSHQCFPQLWAQQSWAKLHFQPCRLGNKRSQAAQAPNFSSFGFHHGLVSHSRSSQAGLGHQVGFADTAPPSPPSERRHWDIMESSLWCSHSHGRPC